MKMWDLQHDTGVKTLLSYPGVRKPVLPANQTGLHDVADAIDNLFEHPNTGPFIARQLIQRLVTSNPSNGYVGRVAGVFANNGSGQRGYMLAVIKAILLDQEARNPAFIVDPQHGKLREPFLRVTHLLRAFNFVVPPHVLPYNFPFATAAALGQYPLSAPSVFNFYLPDYEPPGVIGGAGLVGPEFQILNSDSGVKTLNAFYSVIERALGEIFPLDLSPQAQLSGSTAMLVDNVDLLLTHGTLSDQTRAKVIAAVDGVTSTMVPS